MTNVLAHLNALRSFEAAARHGSFTRAAQELCVTQAAVSHQIRQLEDALGAPLFERSHRRVALTDAGQRLFSTVSMAMHSIEHTLRDIRERGQTQPTLTVLVTPSLGARWLARRLHRFWTTNPEIDLHIYHALPHEQYALRRVDLAIRPTCGTTRSCTRTATRIGPPGSRPQESARRCPPTGPSSTTATP